MASISASIDIYDRVSAPIYNMISAMDKMIGTVYDVQTAMDNGFDSSEFYEVRQAIDLAAREMEEMETNIQQARKQQEEFNQEVQEGASAMDGLENKVLGFVGAYASLRGIQKVVNLSDEMTQTTARLNMMNDGLQTTAELQQMIYQSAQRSRGFYQESADAVAKMGIMAKDAFNSNAELVAFVEQLNKQFTIAGTSQEGVSAAMLQLTQAMSSGVLRGEELNSVFEQAPTIIQSIADYLDVPIGQIREMAAEGQISSEIVKNALLSAAEETDAKFAQMPMTWGQVWTGVMNELYMVSMPVLELINLMANNWSIIEPLVIGAAAAIGLYTAALLIGKGVQMAHAAVTAIHTAFTSKWTVANFIATASQQGLNAALLACPLTWILLIIIAVVAAIYAVVAAINKVTGSTISATGVIAGAIMSMVAFVWNLFLSLVDLVLACVNALVNPWIRFANFFANLFNDPIGAIVHLFGDMADSILGILESIASAIDKVFGSNLAGAVQGWRSGLDSMVESVANEYGNGSYEKVMDNLNLSSESLGLKRWSYGDAYNTGYSWGEGIGDSVSNMFSGGIDAGAFDYSSYDASQLPANIADTADNTGSMSDSMDISSEELKYLHDIAERGVINRFTTAEIKVDMGGITQNISSDMDLDGIIDYLSNGVNEAMEKAAEGVHD